MKYGQFSKNGKEYIVTRMDTPRPWTNILTNGRYSTIVSHVGTGHSFYLDAEWHPITRRGTGELLGTSPGKFLYIRDNKSGEYWNASVAPTFKHDTFEAHHGFGYTTITSSYKKIESTVTYCISPSDDAEIWLIALRNNTRSAKTLSVYSYSDLVMGQQNFEYLEPWFATSAKELSFADGVILGSKKFVSSPDGKGNIHWPYHTFIMSSLTPSGYELSAEDFVGMYRTIQNPVVVEKGLCTSTEPSTMEGKPACGVLRWDITLKPGQTVKFSQVMGVTEYANPVKLSALRNKYKSFANAQTELKGTQKFWAGLLDNVSIATPDKDMNLDINYWIKYQTLINAMTWRNTNNYYGTSCPGNGAGGYRNILCDAEAVLTLDLTLAKNNLLTIASYMTSGGQYAHHTPRPELKVPPFKVGYKVDDAMWLFLAVEDYIRETGDGAILMEPVPYLDNGSGPLWEHIVRGLGYLIDYQGRRGLPPLGTGDWNDALDAAGKQGKAESPWMGMFVAYGLSMAAHLFARYLPAGTLPDGLLDNYKTRSQQLKKLVNDLCWNGDYYIRAFKDDGTSIGDKHCAEGSFFIETNIWAVITGTADTDRAQKTMAKAKENLETPYGMMMCSPAYTKFDPTIGIITAFAPGTHENAAVFSQATIFAMTAWAMLGNAKEAVSLYKKITPIGKDEKAIELRGLEPFAQCQYVDGVSSPDFGKGAGNWLTGTAAWIYKSVVEWILGVRPEYDGLRIDPCIPQEWKSYKVTRPFRGGTYEISVENPAHLSKGVKEIFLDGTRLSSPLIPAGGKGQTHSVKVVMG